MADPSTGEERPTELVYWWTPRGTERVFDLSGWPEEAIGAVKALVESHELAHTWEDACLVVDAEQRDDASALLDEVVAASQPRLDEDADRTAYDLTDWPDYELEVLRDALEGAEITFEWTEDEELLIYEADEARVDELFERLDLRGPDPGVELDGEALTILLTTLFVAADRLAEDADDADAVIEGHRSIVELEQLAVPYGMDPDGWRELVADASRLRRLVEADAGGDGHVIDGEQDVAASMADGADGVEVTEVVEGAEADDADLSDELIADELVDEGVEGDDTTLDGLDGDEAIMALAARVRDRLKRLL